MLLLGGCASGGQARRRCPTVTPSSAYSTPAPSPLPSQLTVATRGLCRAAKNDSADGLDAIVKLAKHPDGKGLSADDFSAPRDNLSEDEQSAPDHLKKYLRVQVEVLDDIVAVFNGEGNRTIKTGK
jgi:hypothetical protein